MNGFQNKITQDFERPFPGCLGRLMNVFDLSAGVAGNRMLTDKSHFDGSGLSRGQSDATRISPIGDAPDEKMVVSELMRSSLIRKSNGTPVKMLLAKEIRKEVEFKHNPPSLVAKLMGLDALPQQQSDSAVKSSHSRSHSGSSVGIPLDSWQQKHRLDESRCKNFTYMRKQSLKGDYMSDKPPEKGWGTEVSNKKKMALVRQKFAEAKHLAANAKLQKSKKFQDALEVLNSNKGLFLELLQEPNSMLSQILQDRSIVSAPPETKCITVLRPSKMLDDNLISRSGKMNAKEAKNAPDLGQVSGLNKKNHAFPHSVRVNDKPPQPTRIVVLKPSGSPHFMKTLVSPPSSSVRVLHGDKLYGEPLDDDVLGSKERAKEITHQLRETLSGYQREEETLVSSVFSNGYVGDESSFHKSEDEYVFGNLSDSVVISPISRHSWDHVHRFQSPYSSSSFSHASFSPESCVCREAKKRLSERWALIESNENCHVQRHVRRNSSTLGEMLALSDTRYSVKSEDGIVQEQETRESPSCLSSNLNIGKIMNDAPRSLSRSKSVPATSTVFVDNADPEVGKSDISREVEKTSNVKSSLKGKLSSLFFSIRKRTSKDRSSVCQYKNGSERSAQMPIHTPQRMIGGTSKFSSTIEDDPLQILQGPPCKAFLQDSVGMEKKLTSSFSEAKLSVAEPSASGSLSENQDQPSPISVLDRRFEEDESIATDSSNLEAAKHGGKLLACSFKSSPIDKSKPIESIARTLSWDDNCADTDTLYPLNCSRASQGTEEEEQELLFFVKSLLSVAGLDGELGSNPLFARWHSAESPLDPSLRDNYTDWNDKDLMLEVKGRQRRSTGKLVFDCVNAALAEMTGCDLGRPCSGVYRNLTVESALVDVMWAHAKEWLPRKVPDIFGDDMDSSSLVADAMVRKEVAGNVWTEHMRLERAILGKEIEVKLLVELMQEMVVELTGRL